MISFIRPDPADADEPDEAGLPDHVDALARLRAAVAAYSGPTGPGRWLVQTDIECFQNYLAIALVYWLEKTPSSWPSPHALIKEGDEPWKLWGGEAILAAAGLEMREGDCDAGGDGDGPTFYADAAYIEVAPSVLGCHHMTCPNCHQDDELDVVVSLWVRLIADGTEDRPGDNEWDNQSPCRCEHEGCGWSGIVKQARDAAAAQ